MCSKDDTLGSILLQMGAVTGEQVEKACAEQAKTSDAILGALLVDMRACTQMHLTRALEVQAHLRAGRTAEAHLALLDASLSSALDQGREVRCVVSHSSRDRLRRLFGVATAPCPA